MKKIRFILIIVALLAFQGALRAQGPFAKSFTADGTLFLLSTENYDNLSEQEKGSLINRDYKNCGQAKISVSTAKGGEVWMRDGSAFVLIDKWNDFDLEMDNYRPITMKRQGKDRLYYSFGGGISGQGKSHSALMDLRAGTFLYKNFLDISAGLSTGCAINSGEMAWQTSLNLFSRAYLPINIKGFHFAYFAGIGISGGLVTGGSSIEFPILAGSCWFIGPGSLDFTLRYGSLSSGVFTIGYTFRPRL